MGGNSIELTTDYFRKEPEIMLVLTRKRMESIKIGNDIVIKVIHTGTGTVKLGIEAPAHVRILRGELQEFPVAEAMPLDEDGHPMVAEAVADSDAADEPVVLGPMTADKFLNEFDDVLPGRSIRRMLSARRPALNAAAK